MSANIKVKQREGVEVLYNNVDTVVLPTSDGGTAVFRKWNGVNTLTSKVAVQCINAMLTNTVPTTVTTSVSVSLS